jgi:UDP-2,3-diacylglucosamine pyrophosphatase LpxH
VGYDSSMIAKPTVEVTRLVNNGTWTGKSTQNENIIVDNVAGFQTAIKISTQSDANFEEGEEYMITVILQKQEPLISYFAINYTLNATDLSIAALGNNRKMVVCISDIHLGQDDLYTECKLNRGPLVAFLNKLSHSANLKEFIVAGDLIDEWFIPGSSDGRGKNTDEGICFAEKVKNNNSEEFKALNDLCQVKNVTVTYVPGNHDLLIDEKQISKVLPNIKQVRDAEKEGLGAYTPLDFPDAIIEHGHRWNIFCAPYKVSKPDSEEDSILPPGYFFTRIAVESLVYPPLHKHSLSDTEIQYGNEDAFMFSLYSRVWKSVLKNFSVDHADDEKFIKTNIGGFTKQYSINDLIPHLEQGKLKCTTYTTITDKEEWAYRQQCNNVAISIPAMDALLQSDNAEGTDAMSDVQFFSNPKSNKRIVVFGHSHVPRILTYPTHDRKIGVYVNSGTWIDNNKSFPTMTFVVLIPPKPGESIPMFVNLYQYLPTGDIVLIDSQATTREY